MKELNPTSCSKTFETNVSSDSTVYQQSNVKQNRNKAPFSIPRRCSKGDFVEGIVIVLGILTTVLMVVSLFMSTR